MKDEIWKDIPLFNGKYQVSNTGYIKSLDKEPSTRKGRIGFRGRILKPAISPKGYLTVTLMDNKNKPQQRRVHRVVALCFLENPNKYDQVNHIDGDKNNNSVKNLEWCNSTHNNREAIRLGLKKIGSESKDAKVIAKIKDNRVIEIYGTLTEAGKENNLSIATISYCANGKTKSAGGFQWRYLTMNKPKVYLKGWGREVWLANSEKYCGKILYFNKGKKCSFHFHKLKSETFYLQRGLLIIRYGYDEDISKAETIILGEGQKFDVPIGLIHQMEAIEPSELFEFSTQHFESDSYRIIKGD